MIDLKKLSELYNCEFNDVITGISINSKQIKKGDLFVCIKGIAADRHDYIDEAIQNGASALIVSKEGNYKVPHILVEDTNKELGLVSKKFYDNPLNKLKLIGVTGTDGKTTTASILRNMIGNDNCGYIGSIGVYCKNEKLNEVNTTPEIHKVYEYLDKFSKNDLSFATMEISSESLLHNRTNTLELDVAILTNITEDHLNVHKTMENYIESKEKIFSLLKSDGTAILNIDDKHFDRIRKNIKNKVLTYGKSINADLVIIEIKEFETGTIFTFSYQENLYKVISPLLGEFNVYNLCASILSLVALGSSVSDAIEKVMNLEQVSGRCEYLNFGQNYKIVLDYAHTPNGLKSILSFLNKIKTKKIITVTGSAGGREKEKRSEMGKNVLELSDLVIFTMDDPRNEDVNDIIDDMIRDSENTNFIRIIDRKSAIEKAFEIAEEDDIVLVVGKGRDNYMAINNQYVKYCDYDTIEEIMKEKFI